MPGHFVLQLLRAWLAARGISAKPPVPEAAAGADGWLMAHLSREARTGSVHYQGASLQP